MHRLEVQREHTRSPPAVMQAQRMNSTSSNRSYQRRAGNTQGHGYGGGGGGSHAHASSYGGSSYSAGNHTSMASSYNGGAGAYSYATTPASPGTSPPTAFSSARPPSALFATSPPSSPPPFKHNDDRLKPRPLRGALPPPHNSHMSQQSLLMQQQQQPQQDMALAVTICGDGGCGKSSLTLRVVRGVWTSEYDPTIEDSYSVTRRVDGQTFSLHITDTAGQEEYRELFTTGSSRALKADAFLLVYSIASRESLRLLDVWATIVDKECEERRRKGLVWPGVMVVGNKCDLSAEREVSAAEGLEWARKRGYGFMETSARECVNIEETFSALVRRVLEARRLFANGHVQAPAAAPDVPLISPGNKWSPQQPRSMMDNSGINAALKRNNSNNKALQDNNFADEKAPVVSNSEPTPATSRTDGQGINAPRRPARVPPKPVGYQDTGFGARLKIALSFQWCV